jgi:hypothetical protein
MVDCCIIASFSQVLAGGKEATIDRVVMQYPELGVISTEEHLPARSQGITGAQGKKAL